MKSFNLDSSSSSDDGQASRVQPRKETLNLQSHIKNNKIQVLGGEAYKGSNQMSKDSLEEAMFKGDPNGLSRGDLSARHDGTPASNNASPLNQDFDRKNKFHRLNFRDDPEQSRSRKRNQLVYDSQTSLKHLHGLLSSEHPLPASQLSSLYQDQLGLSQFRPQHNVIFEQPTKEDAMEDTYKDVRDELKEGLKAEDLTQSVAGGDQSKQDDIYNTYKQVVQIARNALLDPLYQPQTRGSNPSDKKKNLASSKKENADQKSDFTFVLSNKTNNCDCESSFVTQKFNNKVSTAHNSDLKQLSSYRKPNNFQTVGQQPRLQDFAASPIYSENGGLPQFYVNVASRTCRNCGKSRRNEQAAHRLSHNHHQSIKEESQDEDDYESRNFEESQVEQSSGDTLC